MTNPYEPSALKSPGPKGWTSKQLHLFAGVWLAISGILHLAATNVLGRKSGMADVDWEPLFLTALGVLVLSQLRLARLIARLLGAFTAVGLCVMSLVAIVGLGDGVMLVYGDLTINDPQPWHILLLLFSIGATMLPPWWAIERALAGNNRVRPSARVRWP